MVKKLQLSIKPCFSFEKWVSSYFFLFFFILNPVSIQLFAQCSTIPCATPIQTNDPKMACILPGPEFLDCHIGNTNTDPVIVNIPIIPSWCTTIENNHFYAFTATSSTATFVIECIECTSGNGIGAAVFESNNCNTFNFVSACFGGINEGIAETIEATNLTVGDTYFLMIDGIAGSLCEYSINASQLNIQSSSPLSCAPQNQFLNYWTQTDALWTINPPSAGSIANSPPTGAIIEMMWTQPGIHELCAQNINCSNTTPECIQVTVGNPTFTTEEHNICEGGSVICGGQVLNAPGVYETVLTSWQGCDSIVTCIINVFPNSHDFFVYEICEDDCIQGGGQIFCDEGIYEVVIPGGTINGCDSIITFEIIEIDIPTTFIDVTVCGDDEYEVAGEIYSEIVPFNIYLISQDGCDSVIRVTPHIIGVDVEIAEPAAFTCLVDSVTLNATGSTIGDSVTYFWTGPNGYASLDFPEITVAQDGLYCLSIKDTINMEECLECVTINSIVSPPDTPFVYGPDIIYGDFGLFSTDEVPFATEYYWGGVSFTILEESELGNEILIQVDSTNQFNNQICVVVENDCGVSAQGCHDYFLDFPPLDVEILGPSEFCEAGGLFTYLLENDDNTVTNVEWVTLNSETLIVSQPEVAVVEWSPGINYGALCANITSVQYGTYQVCQAIEFIGTDTTFISAEICGGDCFTYQGQDYCDGGIYEFFFTGQNNCDSLVRLEIIELPLPTAELSVGNYTICEGGGDAIDLQIQLTGNAPWIVEWQIDGVLQAPLNINSSPFILTIDENMVGFIELVNIYDGNGCEGTVLGQAIIELLPELVVSNLQIWPSPDLLTYQLYFEISGGDPLNYWVTPLNGTFQTQNPINFISFPIQCGDGYSFSISDGSVCNPIIVQANSIQCECETEAGDMDLTPIEVCGNGPITGNYNNLGLFLDANDVLNFMLHEGNPFNTNEILEIKTFETFSFNPATMNYGQTYYIAAFAGNDDGNGLVDFSDPCFTVSQSQPITFIEAPTAELSGGGEICEGQGGSADLVIELTGQAPWTVVYSDGNSNFTQTFNSSTGILIANQPGTYILLSVEDVVCTGSVSGQAIINEVPTPTASISLLGNGTICEGSGESVDFEINFTGNPNWFLHYTIDGNQFVPTVIDENPYIFSIDESQAGLIEFTQLQDSNCGGDILGQTSFDISVVQSPGIINISEDCNATSTAYTVSFEIVNTDDPVVEPFGSGTLSQDAPYIFTSNPIQTGTNYTFEITDVSGCEPVIVSGLKICDCITSVGEMDDSLIEECGNGPITATYDQTGEAFDSDDVLAFILHEGDGINIINQILVNSIEPTFSFLNGQMNYGQTYYISAVAGNDDGAGNPDLNDPCLDVAQGTPVVFYEIPTAHLSVNQNTICEDEVELIVEFTGNAPWEFSYSDGTGVMFLSGITTNPYQFNVTPFAPTIIILESINDANCDGTVSGIVNISENPIITSISNDTTICDGEILQLMAESSTAVTYEWLPSIGLSCVDCPNPFAAPTQSTNYTVIVTDAQGCTAEESVEVFVQCLTVYDTLHIGEVSIRSLNLPPWIPIQADVCLDTEEHTSIGWFPNGLFYTGLTEGTDTICIPLQHPSSIFNTETFTIYVTVEKKPIFMLNQDTSTDRIWRDENDVLTQDFVKNEVSIYPNPTNGILNVDSKNEAIRTIEIFDLSGKSVLKKELNIHSNQLDIRDLKGGSYFLKIETETEILFRKVILIE